MAATTKSGEPNAAQMRNLASHGQALRASKNQASNAPKFNITDVDHLDRAIRAVGRTRPNTEAEHRRVRRHIIRNAARLHATSHIPDTWNADGSLK